MSAKQKKKGRFLVGVGVGAMLVILAIIYRCSGGHFGSKGGDQKVSVPSAQNAPETKPVKALPPCKLRLDSQGLKLDGKPVELKAAIAACKKSGKATLVITGGANHGQRKDSLAALEKAKVHVFIADPPAGKATPPKPSE